MQQLLRKSDISECAKDTVARIAEPRYDVAMLVEAVVHCRDVDRYVGVVCRDAADALRSGDEAHEDDAARALVLEHGECCRRTAARGEHGVRYDEGAILDAARELCRVLDGGKCLGVARECDVSDACRRDEAVSSTDLTLPPNA